MWSSVVATNERETQTKNLKLKPTDWIEFPVNLNKRGTKGPITVYFYAHLDHLNESEIISFSHQPS